MMGRSGKVLAGFLLLALALNVLLEIALAGTETGEFCPTCPDWTNLEGWLAKKEAYERAQAAQANGGSQQKIGSAVANADVKVEKPAPGYPEERLIAKAGQHLNGFVILDVRAPEDYSRGHIPGARNIYWEDLQQSGSLDTAIAEEMLRVAGVNNSDHVLIYGDDDEGADYVFWALSYLGHKNLTKLDGGVDAAWGAGIAPDSSLPSVEKSDYTVHLVPWMMVNESRLKMMLDLPQIQILDARDFVEYGQAKLTNDSIPLDSEKLYDDRKIKDAKTLNDLLQRRGLEKDGIQMVYGTPKAYSLFYGLRLMGYNATLLEGDWWKETEWAVSNVR